MTEIFFIEVHDVTTNENILIRGDLIFKIEDLEKTTSSCGCRKICFTNGLSEYVRDTFSELQQALYAHRRLIQGEIH